jgi:hypothetical protein
MGRKAARLAAKPHVVGSIALDQRLRGGGGGGGGGPMVFVEGMLTNSTFNSRGGWIEVAGGVAPYTLTSPDPSISSGNPQQSGSFSWASAAMGPTSVEIRDSSPEPFVLNFVIDYTGMEPSTERPLAPVEAQVQEPVTTDPQTFPWDTMTTHAQIDGWVAQHGVAIGPEWGQMTLASKRQWLVAYFDGDRPWETGN